MKTQTIETLEEYIELSTGLLARLGESSGLDVTPLVLKSQELDTWLQGEKSVTGEGEEPQATEWHKKGKKK
jgi:hypothetical protein